MNVGSMLVRMHLPEARTLKDKRQVVRSILDRLRNEFNVAATEVEAHDQPQVIALGFAAVGAEAKPVREALQKIAEALRRHPVAQFVACEMDPV